MPPVWPAVVGLLLLWTLYVVGRPYLRRFDRRMADKREAAGKSRLVVPKWVALVGAGSMVVIGLYLMDTPR